MLKCGGVARAGERGASGRGSIDTVHASVGAIPIAIQ